MEQKKSLLFIHWPVVTKTLPKSRVVERLFQKLSERYRPLAAGSSAATA
jgi:hypothetical protein